MHVVRSVGFITLFFSTKNDHGEGRESLPRLTQIRRMRENPEAVIRLRQLLGLKAFRARVLITITIIAIVAMSTVLNTRAVGLYLVYVTVFSYILPPRPCAESARVSKSVNNGRNTTGGLAYNHLTYCLTS